VNKRQTAFGLAASACVIFLGLLGMQREVLGSSLLFVGVMLLSVNLCYLAFHIAKLRSIKALRPSFATIPLEKSKLS
jgi:hypothetical protein